jgi:hypothetical protein
MTAVNCQKDKNSYEENYTFEARWEGRWEREMKSRWK